MPLVLFPPSPSAGETPITNQPGGSLLELEQDILTSTKPSGEDTTETSLKWPELGSMEEISDTWICRRCSTSASQYLHQLNSEYQVSHPALALGVIPVMARSREQGNEPGERYSPKRLWSKVFGSPFSGLMELRIYPTTRRLTTLYGSNNSTAHASISHGQDLPCSGKTQPKLTTTCPNAPVKDTPKVGCYTQDNK